MPTQTQKQTIRGIKNRAIFVLLTWELMGGLLLATAQFLLGYGILCDRGGFCGVEYALAMPRIHEGPWIAPRSHQGKEGNLQKEK